MDGKRAVLARKEGLPSHFPKTGVYSVDVASFESLALPTLAIPEEHDKSQTVYIIDEVGRMELHSAPFKAAIELLLATANISVVGALTAAIYGHHVAFCDHIEEQEGVEVHRLTAKTRDAVLGGLLQELHDDWMLPRPPRADAAVLPHLTLHLELYFKSVSEDLVSLVDEIVLPCSQWCPFQPHFNPIVTPC